MGQPAFAIIPEKIFFKIGEVCDIVGVQPHVLRYWETEFAMLAPQKNRAGQRAYRKRDVEIAVRIKELLYVDLYTTAGAKKRLSAELREQTKLKIVSSNQPIFEPEQGAELEAVQQFEQSQKANAPINYAAPVKNFTVADDFDEDEFNEDNDFHPEEPDENRKAALQNIATKLSDLREMLGRKEDAPRKH